jgi:Zn-dependent M28 family amino/carboxypeptidase
LREAGYEVQRQQFEAEGKECSNIEAVIKGKDKAEEILVIGAHYDTVYGSPGANDNGSGVAALLAMARRFSGKGSGRTIRFVFFVNEEPPFYFSEQMGSLVYAKRCRERGDKIIGMMSLETMGYYSDEAKSQKYPFPFGLVYPATGNFITFVSNVSSRGFLHRVIGTFREKCRFPSEGGAIPEIISGINWSDHWSFWRCGYDAIMVTDTALFRYPYYHGAEDTAEKIDYERLSRVVWGLEGVIAEMAGIE